MRAAKNLSVLVLAVCLSSATSAMAQTAKKDDPIAQSEKSGTGWLSWLNPFSYWSRPQPNAKDDAKKAKTEVEQKTSTQPATITREDEEAIFLRRQAVCDKLRAIALQIGDDAMLRRAEELEQRAWQIYREHSLRTGGTATAGARDERGLQDDAARLLSPGTSRENAGSTGHFAARKDER